MSDLMTTMDASSNEANRVTVAAKETSKGLMLTPQPESRLHY